MNPANMDRVLSVAYRVFVGLVIFSILGSILQSTFKVDPGPIASVCSFLTIFSGAIVAIAWLRDAVSTIFVMSLGIIAEVAGLYTGVPFGHYEYTEKWVPTIQLPSNHLFPLLLPLSWLLILVGSYSWVRSRFKGWAAALTCGIVAMAIDVPMERAMCDVFHYWTWIPKGTMFGAPVQNAVGWFIVGTIGGGILTWRDAQNESKSPLPSSSLAWFCLMVASLGQIHGFDVAWPMLGILALCLTRHPVAREKQNFSS